MELQVVDENKKYDVGDVRSIRLCSRLTRLHESSRRNKIEKILFGTMMRGRRMAPHSPQICDGAVLVLFILAVIAPTSTASFVICPTRFGVGAVAAAAAGPTSSWLSMRMTTDHDEAMNPTPPTTKKNRWSVQECLTAYQTDPSSIQFVDATWYHKPTQSGLSGREEYCQGPRLPRAAHWDIDDMATSSTLFPDLNPNGLMHMFPPTSLVAATLEAMKIDPHKPTIVYARKGCWFTPHVWYVLKQSLDSVGILQGSLEDWMALGGPVDETSMNSYNVWAKDCLMSSSKNNNENDSYRAWNKMDVLESYQRMTVVDTRGSSFVKGHIPGSVHIPYSSLVVDNDDSLVLQETSQLQALLDQKKIPKNESILLTCGSGVSVCHMALVLEECGYPAPWIYDGSWNEWGSDPETPKEMGV